MATPAKCGYPPFNLDAACAKCTSKSATFVYQPSARDEPQHMRRVCRCCGYRWLEQCADD